MALALCGLLAPGVSRWLERGVLAWLADLMAHWVWLWLPLGAICLFFAVRAWAVRVALAAVMAGLPWLWLPPSLPAVAAPAQLHVVVANVHLSNADPAPLLAWANEPPPDIVTVLELSPRFAQALTSTPQWPHRHLMPRPDSFGIGLLSRWPLHGVREVMGEGGIPQLHALVATPHGEIEVLAIHPMPPVSAQWQQVRNRTLAALRPRGRAPAIVLGDFNATPWSNASPLLTQGGWRWFGGVQPTWPHSAWGIPIDTVWAHGPWQVVSREVGPPIGSDHRPLRVALRLATSPP